MAVWKVRISPRCPWRPSAAVMALHDRGAGRFEIELQSGDTITVTAAGAPVLQRGPVDLRGVGMH